MRFNQKFNILSAIGIIAVVGHHSGTEFIHWFSNSWTMPLFFFISGYFFKDKPFWQSLKHKGKRLVLPYLSWNLFYGIVITLLTAYGFTAIGHSPLSLRSLFYEPLIHGHQFVFNLPAWFVGTLLEVQILFWLVYRLTKRNLLLTGGGDARPSLSILVYGVPRNDADVQAAGARG